MIRYLKFFANLFPKGANLLSSFLVKSKSDILYEEQIQVHSVGPYTLYNLALPLKSIYNFFKSFFGKPSPPKIIFFKVGIFFFCKSFKSLKISN